jgi:predicted DNA-binding transcriptional regulator AlpA
MKRDFIVSQPEALKLTGLSRTTFYRRRRLAGLPFKRDDLTGRISFRRIDIEKLRRHQTAEQLAGAFQK